MENNKDNFVCAPVTLTADIADGGTFTVAYPAGYSVGQFKNAVGHNLSLNGTKLVQPEDIGLSFGASSVTVTNRTGGTLPINSRGYFEFQIMGRGADVFGTPARRKLKRVDLTDVKEFFIDLGSPVVAAANNIATSQSVVVLTTPLAAINGTLLANGVAVLDVPRTLVAAWTNAAICTITGTDEYGETLIEASASGTSLTGKKAFKTVTSVSFNADVTGATVGTGALLGLPVRVQDQLEVIAEYENGVIIRNDLVRHAFQHTEAEADAAAIRYLAMGFAGSVIDAGVALDNTVTTGGAITYTVGAVTIVGLTCTIADGATAGVFYTDTPTNDGTEYFLSTDYLTVNPAAALNASAPLNEWITVRRSNGRLVTGLDKNTKSTATTGDVRGTFKPNTTLDGSVSFGLYVRKADYNDLGNKQYNG